LPSQRSAKRAKAAIAWGVAMVFGRGYVSRLAGIVLAVLASGLMLPHAALATDRASHGALKSGIDGGPRFFSIQRVLARDISASALEQWTLRLAFQPENGLLMRNLAGEPFAIAGFGLFRSRNQTISSEWTRVSAEWAGERKRLEMCRADAATCTPAAREALVVLRAAEALPLAARAEFIHQRVNAAVTYRSDFASHGVADRWSSPLSTLTRAGDCEDYAITKYFLMLEAGIDGADLRIILLRDQRAGEDHAVLAWRGPEGWSLFDNRYNAVDSDNAVAHYRPMLMVAAGRIEMFAAPVVQTAQAALSDSPETLLQGGPDGIRSLGLRGAIE
jgi:predicted transglutaminase-like cysteine proteinase